MTFVILVTNILCFSQVSKEGGKTKKLLSSIFAHLYCNHYNFLVNLGTSIFIKEMQMQKNIRPNYQRSGSLLEGVSVVFLFLKSVPRYPRRVNVKK